MTTFHLAGFPRVGAKRELKFAQERYWRGEIAEADLLDIAKRLRELNWQHQAKANADFVAVADFTLYDHILDLQVAIINTLNNINFIIFITFAVP